MSADGYFNGHCLICGAHVPDTSLVDHKGFWRRAGITYAQTAQFDYSTTLHSAWHQQNGEGIPARKADQ